MSRYSLIVCALVALFAVATGALAQGNADVATVTVIGVGMDKDEATRDAMRKAVERAAGTLIYSQSSMKDFALVRDTVLTRSAGFIQSHEIISATEAADGTWEVKIKAVVSVKQISDMWGVVKTLLAQMGRPKVMVFISERIDGASQDDSTVQTRIEKLLLENGFLLVNREQIQAIGAKDLADAVASDNPAKMQAIAKRFGAQLFISGSTSATLTSSRPVYGVEMHRYGADGDIKCYRSDTAQLLASQNATGYNADRTRRVAAKKSLTALGEAIGPMVRGDVLRFWQDVLEGRGEVVLEVEGVSFKQYVALKKALGGVKEIKDVTATYSNQIARCSIQSDVKAEILAEKIIEVVDDLEVTDISQNVIKARMPD